MWFQLPNFALAARDNWLSLLEFGAVPPSMGVTGITYSYQEIDGSTLILDPPDSTQPSVGKDRIISGFTAQGSGQPGELPDLSTPAGISFACTYFPYVLKVGVYGPSDDPPHNIIFKGPFSYRIINASSNPGLISWLNYSRIVCKGDSSGLYLDAQLMGAVMPFQLTGDTSDNVNRTAFTQLRLQDISKKITLGNWHHLFLAAQISSGNTLINSPDATPTKYHSMIMMLDAQLVGVGAGDSVPGQGFGDTLLDDGVSPFRYVSAGPGGNGFLIQAIHLKHDPQASAGSQLTDNYDTPTPMVRRYQDVQIWLDKFIDPRIPANFAKFVQPKAGKGYPVDPATATRAFGRQSILLQGKSSNQSFYTNKGTLGPMVKTGTITDFTPTASYG